MAQARALPNRVEEREAIHGWHFEIEQYEIRHVVLEHHERDMAVPRHTKIARVLLGDVSREELARIRIIFDDEYASIPASDVVSDRVAEVRVRYRFVDPVHGADEAVLHLAGDGADYHDGNARELGVGGEALEELPAIHA